MLREVIKYIKTLIAKIDHLISLLGFPAFEPIPVLVEDKYLSQKEAAYELKVDVRSVRRYVKKGTLLEDRSGKSPSYKQSDVDRIKKLPLR